MDLLLLIALVALTSVAFVHTFLMGLQTWEHRRFARSHLTRLERWRPTGRAMIFIPCKGFDLGLTENLGRLLRQDYDDYEVTFVVESPWDPAYNLIAQVMAEHPERISHLVVAGVAKQGGQKVHNLRTAIERKVRPDIEYLVFVDSDARPRPEWLRSMIGRLEKSPGDVGAVTGYRWLLPERPTLANHLLYGVNGLVASLLGSRNFYPIWGGSWAIRRTTFEEVGLLDAWRGTLSDDLVATNVLRRRGLGVQYEPACMAVSPVDGTLWGHFAFLRRQYIISRFHLPGLWAAGLIGSSILSVGWLCILAMAAWAIATGSWLIYPAAAAAVAVHGLNMARALIRQNLAIVYLPEHAEQLRRSVRFDVWLNPLAGWFSTAAMLASAVGSTIRWRGIKYRLEKNGLARIVARDAAIHAVNDEAAPTTLDPIEWPSLSDDDPAEELRRKAA